MTLVVRICIIASSIKESIMNKEKIKLLCISILILNDRKSIFELMEFYKATLTSDEYTHIRFDIEMPLCIIIKLNDDGSVSSVKYDTADNEDIFFPHDEDVQKYIHDYKAATTHSKITEWSNDHPVPDLSVVLTISKKSFTLFPAKDSHLFKNNDSIIIKTFKDINKNQLTLLVEEQFPELNSMQKMAIEQLIKSEAHKESRRCNNIVQLAAQKLMDLPYE